MKFQLTKDKTIELKLPGGGGAGNCKVHSDITGVLMNSGDPRGCPAVRLQFSKKSWNILAAGFVPPPEGQFPTSWEDITHQVTWSLPPEFQAPYAALAVDSPDMLVRQTTVDTMLQDLAIADKDATTTRDSVPGRKKLGIRRDTSAVSEKKATPADKPQLTVAADVKPGMVVSSQGMRFMTVPLAEDALLQSALPEYQLLWLARLLPEGKRPTAGSVQTLPTALLASLHQLPDFNDCGGNAFAIYVMKRAVYFAAYREGQLIMFRQCPGVAGWEMLREGVKLRLGLDEEMVDSILDDAIIDPRTAMEPFVRPVLQQLEVSMQYLSSRLNMNVSKVFVMGLPSGARYWCQMAEDALQTPLAAPSAFEGLNLPPRDTVLATYSPSQSQVFLPAIGAARAMMGGIDS